MCGKYGTQQFWDETGMIRCRTARYGGKNEIPVGDIVSQENTISCGVNWCVEKTPNTISCGVN